MDYVKIKTMGNSHGLYLKTADAFEKCIDMCLEYYGLDPCHYFSSARLCFNETLKMTTIRIRIYFRY